MTDLRDAVLSPDGDSQEGQIGDREYFFDEFVSFAAIFSLMAAIIEFDAEARLHRSGIAEQKVDMLSIDAILVCLACSRRSQDVKEVSEIDLGANDRVLLNGVGQDAIEGSFGGAEEVISKAVGQILIAAVFCRRE